MGFFGKLANLAIDVATTPIAIVSDSVTLFGAANDTKSAIVKKAEQLAEDLKDIKDDLKS